MEVAGSSPNTIEKAWQQQLRGFPEFDSIYIKEGFGVGISGFAAM
jgi:hypothetical protein